MLALAMALKPLLPSRLPPFFGCLLALRAFFCCGQYSSSLLLPLPSLPPPPPERRRARRAHQRLVRGAAHRRSESRCARDRMLRARMLIAGDGEASDDEYEAHEDDEWDD